MFDTRDIETVHREWIDLLDRHEAEVVPKIAAAIMRAYQRAGTGVSESHIESELGLSLQRIFDQHYRRVIRTFATWGIKQPTPTERRKSAVLAIERKGWVDDIVKAQQAWIVQNAFNLSVLAAAVTMKAIRAILAKGIRQSERDEGDAVQAALARQGAIVSKARARTIARTETASAADAGVEQALAKHKAAGVQVLGKQWVTAGDERVRTTHRNVRPAAAKRQGKVEGVDQVTVAKIDEPDDHVQRWPTVSDGDDFIVGGFRCSAPRDPRLPAHEVINCRCVCIYVTNPARFAKRQ